MPRSLLFALAWGMHAAVAQTPPATTTDYLHTVETGETLFGIAARFTGRSALWVELQRINRVPDPLRMPPGLEVRIPRALLAPAPTYATVTYLSGEVRIQLPMQRNPEPAQAGQQLPEGSRIDVGSDGYLRLQMVDGSVTRVPSNSRIALSRVREQEATHATETLIDLQSGRVDAEVRPRDGKPARFEVQTPLAVASVRGTVFGVEVQPDGAVTGEVTRGVVGLQGAASDRRTAATSLNAGQGARVDAAGRVGPVRPLPDAPDLGAVPAVLTDATVLRFPLPVPGAIAGHHVRIARDADLADVLRNGKVAAGAAAQFAALDDGDYTLGVRAFDAAGLAGRESTRALRVKARPVAPLIQQPAPDALLRTSQVEFGCTRPEGVERFRLQVARDEGFGDLALDVDTLQECRYTAPLAPGRYHWRVASIRRLASGAADQGPFSAGQRFALVAPPPDGPPPSTLNDDGSLQIHWAAVPGHSYRVQVARDERFDTRVHDQTQAAAVLRLEQPAAGRYFVRIQAVDSAGNAGAFSPVQSVRVGPVLRDANGGAVQDTTGQAVGRP